MGFLQSLVDQVVGIAVAGTVILAAVVAFAAVLVQFRAVRLVLGFIYLTTR
jgi:hypothetical protein